jgi:hypothetical protein
MLPLRICKAYTSSARHLMLLCFGSCLSFSPRPHRNHIAPLTEFLTNP